VISFIEGEVLFLEPGCAVIKNHGIGYQILLNQKDFKNLLVGQKKSFFIHTHVREDLIELYGFSTIQHKQIFILLISVSGIGPKLAQIILSALSPFALLNAIIDKDLAKLCAISGVGKKTAERMSLELKDKALKINVVKEDDSQQAMLINLEQAIKDLGYSKTQSDKALLSLQENELQTWPLEDLIKKTLNVLTGNNLS
jgi:holliday junction DNA helicase RuvA